MKVALAPRGELGETVGPGVAREKAELVEDEARRPDGGGAAKPGQQQLAEQQLDDEQQECAETDEPREHGGKLMRERPAALHDRQPADSSRNE